MPLINAHIITPKRGRSSERRPPSADHGPARPQDWYLLFPYFSFSRLCFLRRSISIEWEVMGLIAQTKGQVSYWQARVCGEWRAEVRKPRRKICDCVAQIEGVTKVVSWASTTLLAFWFIYNEHRSCGMYKYIRLRGQTSTLCSDITNEVLDVGGWDQTPIFHLK